MQKEEEDEEDENNVFKENVGDDDLNKNKNCNICKYKKHIIIVISCLIVMALIIILIIIFSKKDSDKKEEEIKKDNTLKLIYYTSEEGEDITLFSSKIIPHISSLLIDGKEKELINNYYKFDII